MGTLVGFGLLAVYLGGIWLFWRGFRQTQFERGLSNRLRLALLWPVLLIASQTYRRNFTRALKGRE